MVKAKKIVVNEHEYGDFNVGQDQFDSDQQLDDDDESQLSSEIESVIEVVKKPQIKSANKPVNKK